MYRVLIVDDEPIAVKSVEYIINKKFTSLEVAGTERSGRAAIEKADAIHPDIIMMDINMPGIDGLEAIRQIRKVNPNVHFIVISAFDYFDYAVEAVALNVDEYLLKPVKEAKLVETLEKVVKKIDARRDTLRREMELKEKFEMVTPILEAGFINAVCMFDDGTDDLQDYCRLFDFQCTSGYVVAIQFGERENGEVKNKIGVGVKSQSLYPHYRNILKSICNCIVGPMMLNRLVAYVLDEHENGFDQKLAAEKAMQTFYNRAEKLELEISIGIGKYCSNINSARESYQNALRTLQILSTSKKYGNILHYEDIIEDDEETGTYCENEFIRNFNQSVDFGDASAAVMSFESFFSRLSSEVLPDFEALKNKCISIIFLLSKQWVNLNKNYTVMLSQIMATQDVNELRSLCCTYITSAINQIASGKQKKINGIIEKANTYMEEHFCEEISLDSIAKEVNLSPFYFSHFYKEETGINFIDQLVTIRINKAKEYLSQTDASIKDVSRQVGYADPNYFSKLFKKVTGITATEYKEKYGK